MLSRKGFSLIVSGPSGAGKSSLCRALVTSDPGVGMCVTTTTRPPRPEEVEGQDRFFLSDGAFQERIRQGAFAEWASVHGFLYGTTWEALRAAQERHDVVVLDVDVQGAKHWRGKAGEACVTVFVLPPSLGALRRRLMGRGTDAGEALERRILNAVEEIAHVRAYDYLIVNDRIEDAIGRMRAILDAERCRSFRYEGDMVKAMVNGER